MWGKVRAAFHAAATFAPRFVQDVFRKLASSASCRGELYACAEQRVLMPHTENDNALRERAETVDEFIRVLSRRVADRNETGVVRTFILSHSRT